MEGWRELLPPSSLSLPPSKLLFGIYEFQKKFICIIRFIEHTLLEFPVVLSAAPLQQLLMSFKAIHS